MYSDALAFTGDDNHSNSCAHWSSAARYEIDGSGNEQRLLQWVSSSMEGKAEYAGWMTKRGAVRKNWSRCVAHF